MSRYQHEIPSSCNTTIYLSTSSTTGVDYNDNADHEDDDKITSSSVFEPQEFVQPPLNAIYVFDADDKANTGCGKDVAMYDTCHHYVRMVVAERQVPSASYYYFHTDKLIPSGINIMNIESDAGDYLYSDGKELGGCVYVSVHGVTFDPSTGIKHTYNIFV